MTRKTDAETMLDQARECIAVSEAMSDALPVLAYNGPTKECTRCQGNGFKQFMGSNRPYGRCFKCQGKGVQPTDRAMVKACAEAYAVREVERLRVRYRGVQLALSFARAAVEAGIGWTARGEVEALEGQLVSLAAAGRLAAAKVGAA